jgi:hypothetical protein
LIGTTVTRPRSVTTIWLQLVALTDPASASACPNASLCDRSGKSAPCYGSSRAACRHAHEATGRDLPQPGSAPQRRLASAAIAAEPWVVSGCDRPRPERDHAGDGVFEFVGPGQCRQPFRLNTAWKPVGMRGASASLPRLQSGHGAPGAPQPQAARPSQGRCGWRSHIHALSWQRMQPIRKSRGSGPRRRSS